MKVRELTHSQFIVYMRQIRVGKSHKGAIEHCLENELNVGDYLHRILSKGSH